MSMRINVNKRTTRIYLQFETNASPESILTRIYTEHNQKKKNYWKNCCKSFEKEKTSYSFNKKY